MDETKQTDGEKQARQELLSSVLRLKQMFEYLDGKPELTEFEESWYNSVADILSNYYLANNS